VVDELEHLTSWRRRRRRESLDALGPEVVGRSRELLGATAVHLYLLEAKEERLVLHWSAPAESEAARTIGLAELGPSSAEAEGARAWRSGCGGRGNARALVAGRRVRSTSRGRSPTRQPCDQEDPGARAPDREEPDQGLLEDLAAGRVGEALGSGGATRLRPRRPHLVVATAHADDALERALARNALLDRREHALRALVPVPPQGAESLVDELRGVHAKLAQPSAVGVSNVCVGAAAIAHGFVEAQHALLGAAVMRRDTGLVTYDELGPYKYLLRVALDPAARDATIDAVGVLADYDRERGRRWSGRSRSSCPAWQHQRDVRGPLRAPEHAPATAAQDRGDLGNRPAEGRWLMVEIAVKLVRLRASLEGATTDT